MELKLSKFISYLLHPVLLPTYAVLIYLQTLPIPLFKIQKYMIFFIVIGGTFFIPLITLFILKFLGYVKTNDAKTVDERKLPVLIMAFNYLFLGQSLQKIWQVRELTILAYATSISLLVTAYFLFRKTKVSLHMLGISGLLGFFLIYGNSYRYPVLFIAFLVLLTGALASARLYLNAHNYKEIIAGTLLGLSLPMLLNSIL